ncbi:MAG: helix-hairpin-helix domain-containing protein [Bordetella sp.]
MPPPFIASPDVVRLARAATVGLGLSLLASGPLMARVDLNTASQSQLESIRGIGLSMFKRILDERKRNGPFTSPQDFALRVAGAGSKKLKSFQDAGLVIAAKPLPEPKRPSEAKTSLQ